MGDPLVVRASDGQSKEDTLTYKKNMDGAGEDECFVICSLCGWRAGLDKNFSGFAWILIRCGRGGAVVGDAVCN